MKNWVSILYLLRVVLSVSDQAMALRYGSFCDLYILAKGETSLCSESICGFRNHAVESTNSKKMYSGPNGRSNVCKAEKKITQLHINYNWEWWMMQVHKYSRSAAPAKTMISWNLCRWYNLSCQYLISYIGSVDLFDLQSSIADGAMDGLFWSSIRITDTRAKPMKFYFPLILQYA